MMWNGFVCSMMLFSGAAGTICQSPQRVAVTEGETVQLNCTYSGKTNHPGFRAIGGIIWYKDVENHPVCAACSGYHGRVLHDSSIGLLSESLQITDLRMNDTGKYYCEVVIFMGSKYLGNGTEVIVRRKNTTKSNGRDLRWQVFEMGVKLAIFIVINVVTVFLIRPRESHGIVNRNNVI